MVYIKRWFTLVELMIVIWVIGVLSAVIYPYVSGYLERAKNTARIWTTKNTIESIVSKYPESLISYYPFEEWGWNIAQDKSNNNANTVSFPINGITYKQWQIGRWIECNGMWAVGDSSSLNIQDTITISFWIQPYSLSPDYSYTPLSKRGPSGSSDASFAFLYFGQAAPVWLHWRIRLYSTTSADPTNWSIIAWTNAPLLRLNQWTLVTATYDSINWWRIYINWSPYWTDAPSTWQMQSNWFPFRICSPHSANIFSWMLDDIQIYNRRLTADEIHEIYKAGK